MALQKEFFTLEQLLEREPLILMDTGVQTSKGDLYAEGIYPYKHFSEMNPDILNLFLSDYISTEGLIRNPNVFTVEPVISELIRFENILRNKLEHMNRTYADLRTNPRRQFKKMDMLDFDMAEHNREILGEVPFAINRIVRYSQRKLVKIEDRKKFIRMAERTYRIAKRPKVKVSYAARYNRQHVSKHEDLHADEELVAAALYLTAIEGQPSAIFTGDSDILRILNCTILDLDKQERWSRVKEAFGMFPIKVYFTNSESGINLAYDTSKPETYF